jgi:elongation factor Tu
VSHPRIPYASGTIQRAATAYESASRRYTHIDCPGRRALIRTAARGLAIVDAAILVVSAEEGVRAQTREHLLLAKHAGVESFVVFINKCDLVSDATTIDVVELEVRNALQTYGVDGDDVRVIRGSAVGALEGEPWRAGILSLIDALDTDVPLPVHDPDGSTLLFIDELFGRQTHRPHTLAAGRLVRGRLEQGRSYVRIGFGDDTGAEIESIEVFRQRMQVVEAGEQVGVMLSGPLPVTFRRGQVLAEPASGDRVSTHFHADIELLTDDQGGRHTPIFSGHVAHFHLGVAGVTGQLVFDGPRGIEPGQGGRVTVELMRGVYLAPGMTFTFKDGSDGLQRRYGGAPRWSGTAGFGRIKRVL